MRLPKSLMETAVLTFISLVMFKILFVTMYASTIDSANLFTIQGRIERVHIGGKGKPTYIDVKSSGNLDRYSSFFGRVWPGMEKLQEGDIISITAWEKGQAGRHRDPYPHYYIWQLSKGNEVVINGEDIRKLTKESDSEMNNFLNWSVLVTVILTFLAYIRHKRLKEATGDSE